MILFWALWLLALYLVLKYNPIKSCTATKIFIVTLTLGIGNALENKWIDYDEYVESGIVVFIYVFAIKLILSSIEALLEYKPKMKPKTKLFPSRQEDLKRIAFFLQTLNIIGINASWGTGKTYLLNQLKKQEDIQKEYIVLEINILACNVDQVVPSLISDLDHILQENGILSVKSATLENALDGHKDIRNAINFLFGLSSGYSKTLEEFKKELSQIDKKILIVYEDLDRIDDKKVIRQILAIGEKLSDEHIKIIYQYDQKKMEELGFSLEYLEKYIPFNFYLTPITFSELLSATLNELDPQRAYLQEEKFQFLTAEDIKSFDNNLFQLNKISPIRYSPRNVHLMIDEILQFLDHYDNYRNEEIHKRALIHFMLIKHVAWEYMPLLSENNIRISIQLKDKFIDQQNQKPDRARAIFYFLGYQDKGDKENVPSWASFRKDLLREEHNLKLDRIYGNLLISGTSVKTDREKLLDNIKEKVLTKKDINSQYKAWKKIVGTDSGISAKWGESNFELVYQWASMLNPFSLEEEKTFLKLFFTKRRNIGLLDEEFCRTLRWADFDNIEILNLVLQEFSKFKEKAWNVHIAQNVAIPFIGKLLTAFEKHGYLITQEYKSVNRQKEKDNIWNGYREPMMEGLKQTIEHTNILKNEFCQYKSSMIVEIIDTAHFQDAIQTCEFLINFLKEYEPGKQKEAKEYLDENRTSQWQTELEKLKSLKQDNAINWQEESLKSLKAGKINWNDFFYLLRDDAIGNEKTKK